MTVIMLARRSAIAAFALGCLCFAGPAAAQQPSASAIATAKELLATKGATTMFDPVISGMVQSTVNTFLPSNPGLFRDFNEVATRLRTEFAPRRDAIIDEIARIYALRFTEAEMKEVIAFYKSPTGKKFVADEPALIEQGLKQAEAWAKKTSEDVMTRFRAEMKKKGHDL